jgi:hypothetical protein
MVMGFKTMHRPYEILKEGFSVIISQEFCYGMTGGDLGADEIKQGIIHIEKQCCYSLTFLIFRIDHHYIIGFAESKDY